MTETDALIAELESCLEGRNQDYVVRSDNMMPLIDEALAAGILCRSKSGRMVQRPANGPEAISLFGKTLPIIGALVETFDLTPRGKEMIAAFRARSEKVER